MINQCSSCGGFCKKSGCERENVKPTIRKNIKELTDEEILEVWKENEKVYPMDRSRLLDRTRACIRKAQIEVGCAECGANGNHALYCVKCAEKFVGEADAKLQQKQETIEGLNRDYDLLFAEYQLLLKNTRGKK